jgi:GntR family transcriptional regulator
MVSFEKFTLEDGSPIYLQIIRYIKRGIVSGTVAEGDELPSRRVLSALLGVNPNTVQKAFRLLEDEGLIASHSGAKSYVSIAPDRVPEIRRQLVEEDMGTAVAAMKQMGLTRDEAVELVIRFWEEQE